MYVLGSKILQSSDYLHNLEHGKRGRDSRIRSNSFRPSKSAGGRRAACTRASAEVFRWCTAVDCIRARSRKCFRLEAIVRTACPRTCLAHGDQHRFIDPFDAGSLEKSKTYAARRPGRLGTGLDACRPCKTGCSSRKKAIQGSLGCERDRSEAQNIRKVAAGSWAASAERLLM